MPRYTVDVKCFVVMDVIADDEEGARIVADAFVENALSADWNTCLGWNAELDADSYGTVVPAEIGCAVDGESDVEEADDAPQS